MTLDVRDLRPLDAALSGPRDLRAADVPAPARSETELLAARLLTAGRYARAEGGGWCVAWADTITGRAWPVDARHVADRITHGRMRPDAADPLTAVEVAAVVAALVALLDERDQRTPRTAPVLTLAQAVARRFLGTWTVRRDRHGALLARRADEQPDAISPGQRFADMITGRGDNNPIVIEPIRRPARTGDVELTVGVLEDLARDLVSRHERVEWAAVLDAVRAHLPAEQPRPGSWLRPRSSTSPTP